MTTTIASSSRAADRAPTSLGIAPERLHVWRRFLEAHAYVIDVLERELREDEDLPLTWYDVLVHLAEAEDHRLRIQELADAVLLSKSGLSRLVTRMEQAGLVVREACTDDRRGTFAVLTDAGYERLRQTAPTHARGISEHFTELLTADEVAVLGAALDRIASAARAT